MLGELIWGPHRHRIAMNKLFSPPTEGGLGVPNIELYYAAAQLQWPTLWLASPNHPEREQIQLALGLTHIYTWLSLLKPQRIRETCIMKTARVCWRRYIMNPQETQPYSPLLPLVNLPPIQEIQTTHDLAYWKMCGIEEMRDLFNEGTLMTFPQVMEAYDIPGAHFLKYRAVVTAITKYWPSLPIEPNTTATLHTILSQGVSRKAVSVIYSTLLTERIQPLSALKAKWEADLLTPISEAQWTQAKAQIKQISRNMRLKFTQLNYLHRTYLTPHRLHTMYETAKAGCPRCTHDKADFMHMVWQCPVIADAWEIVLDNIADITESAIPNTPNSCLLGIRRVNKQNRYRNKFLDLALVLYKRQIAMNWKASKAPEIKIWLKILLKWSQAEVEAMLDQTGREGNPEGKILWDGYVQKLVAKNDTRPP